MYDIRSTLYLAQSQLGYQEGRSGARWNNAQKFSDQVAGLEWSDGQPWCATFTSWCYTQTGIKLPAGAISASCAAATAAYRKAGRWTEYPLVGAQALYGPGGGTHTGIVLRYDADYVYCVEGNTNTTGSAEGDGVYLKKRARRDAYVYGYGIPYYENDKADTPDPLWRGKPLGR